MPKATYKTCKGCGKSSDEVGLLSHQRLCEACGTERLTENVLGISQHRGPAFLRWRRASAAAYGAVLLDDLQAKP